MLGWRAARVLLKNKKWPPAPLEHDDQGKERDTEGILLMHYYQFNIGDYRKDTAHLSPIEHYIYRQLIDWQYLDEKPIPKETQSVLRRLSLGSEYADSLANVLADFFIEGGKGWSQSRIDDEIAQYHENAKKNRVNGKKGGRPRKKTQSVSGGLPLGCQPEPNQNPSESQKNPNQEPRTNKPITNNQEPVLKPLSVKADVSEVFEHWKLVMVKSSQAKLNNKRKACIEARIKEGYTVEQIKQAIDGCSRSPHHMGQNDTGTRYDDLTLICRSGDKVEQFSSNIGVQKPVVNQGRESGQERRARLIRERNDQMGIGAAAAGNLFEGEVVDHE